MQAASLGTQYTEDAHASRFTADSRRQRAQGQQQRDQQRIAGDPDAASGPGHMSAERQSVPHSSGEHLVTCTTLN